MIHDNYRDNSSQRMYADGVINASIQMYLDVRIKRICFILTLFVTYIKIQLTNWLIIDGKGGGAFCRLLMQINGWNVISLILLR